MDKDLVDYIRSNRSIYTRQALDDRLRGEGYTDEEIEAAWQQALSQDAQSSRPSGQSRGSSACLALAVIVLTIIGAVLLVLTNMVLGSWSYGDQGPNLALWFVNIGTLMVLAAIIAGGNWLARQKGWPSQRIAGLVVIVVVVWYLIVAGTCVNNLSLNL
jgi:hypothetical protein